MDRFDEKAFGMFGPGSHPGPARIAQFGRDCFREGQIKAYEKVRVGRKPETDTFNASSEFELRAAASPIKDGGIEKTGK